MTIGENISSLHPLKRESGYEHKENAHLPVQPLAWAETISLELPAPSSSRLIETESSSRPLLPFGDTSGVVFPL